MTHTARPCIRYRVAVAGTIAAAWVLLAVAEARACGGFFCNQRQNPSDPIPVAQTAENVVFAVDKDATTAITSSRRLAASSTSTSPSSSTSWRSSS